VKVADPGALRFLLDLATCPVQERREALWVGPFADRATPVGALDEHLLMPHVLECVKLCATSGEIIGVLRETCGEYAEQNII